MYVQYPSARFSMSAFGPLQKFTLTLVASGALKRISTRELLSTCGYLASRTLDEAGLKSPESCAKPRLAAIRSTIPITRMKRLHSRYVHQPERLVCPIMNMIIERCEATLSRRRRKRRAAAPADRSSPPSQVRRGSGTVAGGGVVTLDASVSCGNDEDISAGPPNSRTATVPTG